MEPSQSKYMYHVGIITQLQLQQNLLMYNLQPTSRSSELKESDLNAFEFLQARMVSEIRISLEVTDSRFFSNDHDTNKE